jgi:hypothetical protein
MPSQLLGCGNVLNVLFLRCLLRFVKKEEVLMFEICLDLDCSRLSSIRHGKLSGCY